MEMIEDTAIEEASIEGAPAEEASIEEVFESIWRLTEEVLGLLRVLSQRAVHKDKKTAPPWLDELTETQSNAAITVRQLCEKWPMGVTLKKLAEALGITPAGASVMVDLLVKKRVFKRTKSKTDRRAVLITLTPDMSELFDISEDSLLHSFMELQKTLGEKGIRDWQGVLVGAVSELEKVVEDKILSEEDGVLVEPSTPPQKLRILRVEPDVGKPRHGF